MTHGIGIHTRPRHKAQRPDYRRMIGIPFRIRVTVRRGFGEQIFAVRNCRLGQPLQHLAPLWFARQAELLAPGLRRLQRPAPIGQLKGGIERMVLRKNLLRTLQRRPEHVTMGNFIPRGVTGHELRRGKDHVAILLQRGAIPMNPPAQLGIENRMRLLPHQERPHRRRRLRPAGTRHLRPARPGVALLLCRAFRTRQDFLVVVQAAFQQRQPIPQRKMRLMPPVHFQMKLTFPRIIRQPRLLRWVITRILNGRQVL